MPDRTQLKIGDRMRLVRIPQGDLEQRERELRAGWPARRHRDEPTSVCRIDAAEMRDLKRRNDARSNRHRMTNTIQ